MKVLITGIDGFIGNAIALRLRLSGAEVVGFSVGPMAGKSPSIHLCAVTDEKTVQEIFRREKPDACIHLAGRAHAVLAASELNEVRSVNVDGALIVARAAAETGVKKFIFFSSAKVYGEETTAEGVDEDAEPNPMGSYARFKLEAEHGLMEIEQESSMGVVCVRPVAVFGPGDVKGNYARMIRAIDRGFFPVVDKGRAKRSIAYLGRVAERVEHLLGPGFKSRKTYIFCDGTYKLKEIVQSIRMATGFGLTPSIPSWVASAGASGFDILWSRIRSRKGPMRPILDRITQHFVVRANHYDSDFGALPAFDLDHAILETCNAQLPLRTGIRRWAK